MSCAMHIPPQWDSPVVIQWIKDGEVLPPLHLGEEWLRVHLGDEDYERLIGRPE